MVLISPKGKGGRSWEIPFVYPKITSCQSCFNLSQVDLKKISILSANAQSSTLSLLRHKKGLIHVSTQVCWFKSESNQSVLIFWVSQNNTIYYLFLNNKKNLLLFLFIGSKQQATRYSFAQMKILVLGNSLSQSLLNLDSNCHPMNFLHHLLSQERFFRNVIYVLCFYCTLEDLQSLKEWIVTIQTVLLLEELKNSLLMNIWMRLLDFS